MGYWDETDRIIARNGGRNPVCPACTSKLCQSSNEETESYIKNMIEEIESEIREEIAEQEGQ